MCVCRQTESSSVCCGQRGEPQTKSDTGWLASPRHGPTRRAVEGRVRVVDLGENIINRNELDSWCVYVSLTRRAIDGKMESTPVRRAPDMVRKRGRICLLQITRTKA